MTRQQRRQARKILRTVNGAIAFTAFFMSLGVVGGIEHDTISLVPGALWSFALIAAGGLFSWLAGAWN